MNYGQFTLLVGLGLGFFIGLASGIGLVLIGEWADRRRNRVREPAPPPPTSRAAANLAFLPPKLSRVTDKSIFYRDHWGRMRQLDRGVFERALAAANKTLAESVLRKN